MYEAMRQHAPASSKVTGVTITALAVTGAIYALMNGLGQQIAHVLQDPTIFVVVPPIHQPDPPPTDKKLDTSTETLTTPPPIWTPSDFVPDDDSIVVAKKDPPPPNGEIGASVAPPGPTPTRPKMIPGEKPPYPIIEIRSRNEGITDLLLCVSAAGRVTSASVAQSSGHERLDDAALKWVRNTRFTPATVAGAPAAVCGHRVAYEWKIETKMKR